MKKILFVDDNPSIREIFVEALRLEGFQVFEAEGGQEGIDIAKSQLPDLILCDIMMPEINGYQVYELLKADQRTAMIPFVFLTALSEVSDVRKGMILGVDDYVTKPISLDELLNTIYTRFDKSVKIERFVEQKLDELRSKIIRTIPHEFLTPLNGILGFSSILKDEVNQLSRTDIKQMASLIEISGRRLHELVISYLNYTRIAIKAESNDVRNIKNIDQKIEKIARNISSKYDRDSDLFLNLTEDEMFMDWEDFEFAIRALIDNAFKFSTSGSEVVVTNIRNGSNIEINVTDLGIGFPMEKISDIGAFNQFYRERIEQQGSGLGLISTLLISQRYNGKLEIKRNTNGTTVLFAIPIPEYQKKYQLF